MVLDAPIIRRLLQRRGLDARRPIWSGLFPYQRRFQELGAQRYAAYGRVCVEATFTAAWRRSAPNASGSSAAPGLIQQSRVTMKTRSSGSGCTCGEGYLAHRFHTEYDAVVEACCPAPKQGTSAPSVP